MTTAPRRPLALTLALALFVPQAARAQDEADEPTEPAPISIQIEGEVDAELAPVAGAMTTLFYTCYPRLLERLDNPDRPAPRTIRLKFAPRLDVPAYCSGNTVTVSAEWLRKHPEDIGLFTHELTHAVQRYRRGSPGWLTEGIADYTRRLYGPEDQPGWALPSRLSDRQSYKDGYRVTGRFLLWLDDQHPGALNQIHRRLQAGEFSMDDFEKLCGSDVETLWRACVASLDSKPDPDEPKGDSDENKGVGVDAKDGPSR